MARIKSVNTVPELKLRRALWKLGIRGYKLHQSQLPGCPDIAFTRKKVAVFVDGDFWHGYNWKFKGIVPKKGYWLSKISKNIKRRKEVRARLQKSGWVVVEIWEHDIIRDAYKQANIIKSILKKRSSLLNNN